MRASPGHPALVYALLGTLLACAGAVFVVRTVMQPQHAPMDFAVVWTSSRAWLSGDDPYDRTSAMARWQRAGGNADVMSPETLAEPDQWLPILGIPPLLPVLAPLATLSAPAAIVWWYVAIGVLLMAQTAALARLIGSALWRPTGLVLFAITLAFAPLHECFGYGQASAPSISLIIIAIWLAHDARPVSAGIALAFATALKPQLAGLFFVYYLVTGRWRLSAAFAVTFGILCAIAIVPMQINGIAWLHGWLDNLRFGDAPGGVNSPSLENPRRFHLLNLQAILHGLYLSRLSANVLSLSLTAAIAAAFAWVRRHSPRPDELLCLSAVSVITLLPVYHRFYDAALMLIPLAWGIANLRQRPRWAIAILLFAGSFMIPAPAVARLIAVLGTDAETASGFWWDALLEPSRVWILLLGLFVMFRAMRATVTAQAPRRSPDHAHELPGPLPAHSTAN